MRWTVYGALALLIGAGLLPLGAMLIESFRIGGTFGLDNYAEVLGGAQTWRLLRNSVALASLTMAAAGLLGVPLAILAVKTDLPLRYVLAGAFSLPILFPPYILAAGWFELLGRGGLLSQWLGPTVGEWTSPYLFGLAGATLVLTTAFVPVVLLLTMAYLRAVNPTMEEAARLSASWPSVLRRITVPLVTPGVVLSLVLVFLLSMGEFGAPAFLRVDVFPVASFTQFAAFYDFGAATAAALPLVLVTLAGLIIESGVLGHKEFHFSRGRQQEIESIELGRGRIWMGLVAALAAATLVGAPLGALAWRGLSAAALAEAIEMAGDSAIRSLIYATIAATVLTALGFLLAYLIHRRISILWRWADALGLFLFTLPGTVIGVGLIVLWNRPPTVWVYATPAIVLIGFIAQYSALSTRTILAGLSQISSSLEEAAEVAGASWRSRALRILVPLARRSLAAAWTVCFLFTLRDVSLPLLLAPPGRDTLTARTMTLMANGSPELIAALCLLSLALALVPLGVFAGLSRSWRAG